MMWKEDIKAEIEQLDKDIRYAESRYRSTHMQHFADHAAIMRRQRSALESILPLSRKKKRYAY